MTKIRIAAATALAGGVLFWGVAGAAPGRHPVAVELFTSQGCSSCPPADAIMATFVDDPGVVAITRPVTYWDRLGWKDTLASPANTELQRGYAARRIPGAGVYTPQTVVQGRAGAVGGRREQIRAMISAAQKLPEPGLTIARSADGGRSIVLAGVAPGGATVSLLALKRETIVAIGKGENGGRRVRYNNHVVREDVLGEWRGGPGSFLVKPPAMRVRGADRYAVMVRQGVAGPILAARYL